MKKTLFILSLAMSTLTISCSSDSTDDLTDNGGNQGTTEETYDGSIKAIVDQSCATSGCHDATTKRAGVDLSTFALAKAGFGGRAWVRTNAGTMPPSGALPSTTTAKIKSWIDNGFKEN